MIDRYYIHVGGETYEEKGPNGHYVHYDDHEKIVQEKDEEIRRLQDKLSAAKREIDDLCGGL